MASFDDTTDASESHHLHHLTLGSVADTFRHDDYEPPPPGIDPDQWANLVRRDKHPLKPGQGRRLDAPADEDDSSLLNERILHSNSHSNSGGSVHEHEEDEGTPTKESSSYATTSISGARRPASSSTAETRTHASSSSTTFDSSIASHARESREEDDSVADETQDRTASLSQRLAGRDGDSTAPDRTDDSAYLDERVSAATRNGNRRQAEKKVVPGQNMTLREQEKVIDELKKDNFSLKLKLHFYEQRLEKMAPSSVEQALRENIQLKVEFQTLRGELKRYKKLLLEGDKALRNLTEERDALLKRTGGRTGSLQREKEVERELKRVKEERDEWENKARELDRKLRKGGQNEEEVEDLRAQLEDALAESDDLKRHLQDATDELEDLRDEVGTLRRDLADQADQSTAGSASGDRSRGVIRREVEKLEQDNASLRSQLTAQLTMLSTRNDEKDALRDQVEHLKQDLGAVEDELESALRRLERAEGKRGAGADVDDASREDLERDLDMYRDRATALALELEETKSKLDEKEHEIEELLAELDEKDQELKNLAERVDEEWREEVEGARQAEKEAKDVLEEREADVQELADRVEQLVRELTDRKAELASSDEEVEALTHDLQKLGAQIFTLEEELDARDKEVADLDAELKSVEKELEEKRTSHDQVVATLKEKLAATKSRLSEVTIQHETATTEAKFLRSKNEDLTLTNGKLVEQARQHDDEKRRLQGEADEIMQALKKEEEERDADEERYKREAEENDRRWRKELEEVEADLRAAQSDVKQLRSLLSSRETELESLQSSLSALESSTRRQGENAKFAADLEVERMKRDLARAEKEVDELREEVDRKIREVRQLELEAATLNADNRELSAQVASQTQTRLALAEKHDTATRNLRDTQTELASARDRLKLLEDQLSTDHRQLSKTENEYRDMLNERNTLLLTVYEYMDRISAADKRRAMSSPSLLDSPKPFANFGLFNNRLLERLKAVSLIQSAFERRVRDVENSFSEQLSSLKKQQESRLKQIDRFEASIRTATENQKQWRAKVHERTLELKEAQDTVADLQEQLLQLRRSSGVPGSPAIPRSPNPAAEAALQARLASAQSRAASLDRRLTATQAQLKDAEDKLGEMRLKIGSAEGKWEARFRELEARCRAAEEKVKRERQGAKERVSELQTHIRPVPVTRRQERVDELDRVLKQTQQP
ncbi:hypothetical protein JCM10212_002578 [Sporobolomyces blumeae]